LARGILGAESTPEPHPESPFERFKRLTTKVVSVPRAEIQKRELQWKNERKNIRRISGIVSDYPPV